MIDPIKEKLKTSRRHIQRPNVNNQDSVLPEIPSIRATRDTKLQRLYNVGNPVQIYRNVQSYKANPKLDELDSMVTKINKGQKQLEKIRLMDKSPIYRGLIHAYDGVSSLFRRQPTKTDIFELFISQQGNIDALNSALASMVCSNEINVKETRNTLDKLLHTTSYETIKRKLLDKEIPSEITRYDNSVNHLDGLDREKDPEKFYNALQEVIDAKRLSRKKRFEYVITSMSQNHHENQIENLMLQEELFETMLFRVMELAYKTKLYQEELNRNIPIWQSTIQFGEAVRKVSGGIAVLSDYCNQIQSDYIRAQEDIHQITDNHPGSEMLLNSNQSLRRLVQNTTRDSYRAAIPYEHS